MSSLLPQIMRGEDAILILAWQQVCHTKDSSVSVYSEKVSSCDTSDKQGPMQKTVETPRMQVQAKKGLCRHGKSIRPCKPTQF